MRENRSLLNREVRCIGQQICVSRTRSTLIDIAIDEMLFGTQKDIAQNMVYGHICRI